uniref:Uncharacterized LOC102312488 n=1 Tax=Haplochromis burtoni TaxID=8153 RepID=A0A3Q2VC77_HAPBU
MPRKNELSEALRSQIVDLHKAGKGYKIIARTLDIHRNTVRDIVLKWKRFSTVATLPRSGRPRKTSAKTKISEVGNDSSEPKDRGEDLHHKKQRKATAVSSNDETTEQDRDFSTTHKDGKIIHSDSSRTQAADEENMAGPSDIRGGSSAHKMSDNIICSDGNTDSYSSDEDEEDPIASHLSAGIAESRGGDPDHEMHQGTTNSASSDDETTEEDPTVTIFHLSFFLHMEMMTFWFISTAFSF